MDPDHGNSHDMAHGQEAFAWVLFDAVVILALAGAAAAYAAALWATRGRNRWPVHRTMVWYAGVACAGAALIGPVAEAAHTSFTAHMAGHLLLGMLAPLLLVLGVPVTLALRAPVVRVITHPVAAGALTAGGLWALYGTDLYPMTHTSVLLHGLVHAHIFLAGFVFTAALVGVDPDPHRATVPVRAAVLVVFIASHSVLAKWLYAHPPAGVAGRRRPGGCATDVLRLRRGGRDFDRAAARRVVERHPTP